MQRKHGSAHWICVFNPDRNRSENNTCYTLNSLSRGKITKNVDKKIWTLLLCKEPVIKVVINPVQQLGNGVDCGVFAIAYATSLAFDENPSLCSFNVPIMRKQLVSCFEKETMYPFSKQHKRSFKIQKKSTVTQYLLFMLYSMPIWKRRSSGCVYEMLWVVPPEVRKNTT